MSLQAFPICPRLAEKDNSPAFTFRQQSHKKLADTGFSNPLEASKGSSALKRELKGKCIFEAHERNRLVV
jgi:hypothetical protein